MLRIYLGAAPGAGKTYAMLAEGIRRQERGAEVVIGAVRTHGRAHTEGLRVQLESVQPREGSLDVTAVLKRCPDVVLVDEFARHWHGVVALVDAGMTVISTVNIDELDSLTNIVEKITGVRPRLTVPDVVAGNADQIQLVDGTPEALRRRMSQGNIYPAEKIDVALSGYFRMENLAALRELALLWVADRVHEGLQKYRADHDLSGFFQTHERIVVALKGGPEGQILLRRAARLAARIASRTAQVGLLAVHVLISRDDPVDSLELSEQRALTEALGGSYHVVRGTDPASALVEFAQGVGATQLVLGASDVRMCRAGSAPRE
jgi:two-component system sensor histidine kinase KdpD